MKSGDDDAAVAELADHLLDAEQSMVEEVGRRGLLP